MRNEHVELLSDHKKQILVALDEKGEILDFASFEPVKKMTDYLYNTVSNKSKVEVKMLWTNIHEKN